MRSREEDSLGGRVAFRACCQWQPQLSKKRDFLPILFPPCVCATQPSSLREREMKKTFPRPVRSLGNDRGTERNRRASNSLSPVLIHFLAPLGKLYQRPLALERVLGSIPLLLITQERSGPKQSKQGIPSHEWPNVVRRVLENQEPLRKVAKEYGVSYETVRRIVLASEKEESRLRSCYCDTYKAV